jgi:hypothetical protein
LQGSDLGDGRVNLFSLDQRIDALLIELQSGQIFSKLETLMQNAPAVGEMNLYELRQEIYKIIKNDNDPNVVNFEDVKNGLDGINELLNWLMGVPYPNAAYTDLYDLLQQLICICQTNRHYLPLISQNMPVPEPILDADGGLAAPGATATAPPADICQRIGWLIDKLRAVLLNMCSTSAPNRNSLEAAYFAMFNVQIPREYSMRLTTLIDHYVNYSGGNKVSMVNYITSIADNLRCALYNATDSANAKLSWDTLMDTLGGDAERDSAILKHAVWDELLTELYAGNIPRGGITELYSYSDDCSDCGGGGGTPPEFGCLVTTNSLTCGSKLVNNYRYYISSVGIGGGWQGKSQSATNGWWVGDCSHNFSNYVFLVGNFDQFSIRAYNPYLPNEYEDFAAAGGEVFWCDNPMTDNDIEAAALANQFTETAVTINPTSYLCIIARFPTTAPEVRPSITWRLCAPGSE